MSTHHATGETAWFVRSTGTVKGPYPLSSLVLLRERGQLSPSSEISTDRQQWHRAGAFPQLFEPALAVGSSSATRESDATPVNPAYALMPVQPLLPGEMMPPLPAPEAALPDDLNCFYSVDGTVYGPVKVAEVRQRAMQGQLVPSDAVWLEGQSHWMRAGDFIQVGFPTRRRKARSWIRENPALVTCLTVLILALFGIPTWYVIAQDRSNRAEIARQEEERQRAIELVISERDKKLAEIKEDKQDLQDREQSLLLSMVQMDNQMENVRLEWATLQANSINADRVQERMDALQKNIDAVSSQLSHTRDEIAAIRTEAVEANRVAAEQLNRIGEEAENQTSELKKQTREAERQTKALEDLND